MKPLTHEENVIEAAIDLIAKSDPLAKPPYNVDSFALHVLRLSVKGLLEAREAEAKRAVPSKGEG